MLPTRGRLTDVVCPAHRDGECESRRVACPFSHDLSKVRPPPRIDEPAPKRRHMESGVSASPADSLRASTSASVGPSSTLVCPRLTSKDHSVTSKISLATRQDGVKKMFTTLCRFYAPLLQHSHPTIQSWGRQMAAVHAKSMEVEVFKHASEYSYKTSCMTAAASVLKRATDVLQSSLDDAQQVLEQGDTKAAYDTLQSCTEIGTHTDVVKKREQASLRQRGRLTRTRLAKAGFLCPKGDLATLGYLTSLPEEWGPGSTKPDATGEEQTCVRCGMPFTVGPLGVSHDLRPGQQDPEACRYHPGRPRREATSDPRARKVLRWTCCGRAVDTQTLGDDRCATGPHVFKEEQPREMHRRSAYVTWHDLEHDTSELLDVAALDCEMSYSTAGLSVTRITLVDAMGDVVFDELIQCSDGVSIVDFNTQFSGIQPDEYEAKAIFDLEAARRALAQYIGPETVLVRSSITDLLDWPWIGKRLACYPPSAHECGRYLLPLSTPARLALSPGPARACRPASRENYPGRRRKCGPLLC